MPDSTNNSPSEYAFGTVVPVPIYGPSIKQRFEFEKFELSTWENEGSSTRLSILNKMRPPKGQCR